ncbi:MAG: type II toxin-antitoxin system RelE/ParE family toxin [Dehalococcoidia bacterium]
MRLEYSDGAQKDLNEIHDAIREGSPDAARRFTEGILRRARQIGLFPNSGRVPLGQEHTRTRELVEGQYIISYAVGPETVIILGITHGARER